MGILKGLCSMHLSDDQARLITAEAGLEHMPTLEKRQILQTCLVLLSSHFAVTAKSFNKNVVACLYRALQFLHQQRVALKQARDADLRKIEDDFFARAEGLLDRRRFVVVGKERSTERQALAVADDAKKGGSARFVENMVVPRFWLLALKGCPVTVELIRRADERILAYLADGERKRAARA